jgi:5-methylthioribose kinase
MNSKSINDLDDNLVAYQDLFADVDMNGFMEELDDLKKELKEDADGAQHVSHLKKNYSLRTSFKYFGIRYYRNFSKSNISIAN